MEIYLYMLALCPHHKYIKGYCINGKTIYYRLELADYCKRQLGAPVLRLTLLDEQVEDIIDDAIQYFQERHFDGVSQAYLKYKITQDDIDRGKASMETGKKQTGITTTTATADIAGTDVHF